MKLVTIIRSHGVIGKLVDPAHPTKTVVKTDNDDEVINKIVSSNQAIMSVETIYDDKTGQLFDITYIQVDAEDNDDDDDDDNSFRNDPDFLKGLLK